jgi:hypothetical protein
MTENDTERFRQQAEECRREADKAISPLDKEAWLRLAADWLKACSGSRRKTESEVAVKAGNAARPRTHDCDGLAVRRRRAGAGAREIDRALATRAGFFLFVRKYGQSTDYILRGDIQPMLRYSRLARAEAEPEPQVGPVTWT